jgi:hypothetical protein
MSLPSDIAAPPLSDSTVQPFLFFARAFHAFTVEGARGARPGPVSERLSSDGASEPGPGRNRRAPRCDRIDAREGEPGGVNDAIVLASHLRLYIITGTGHPYR